MRFPPAGTRTRWSQPGGILKRDTETGMPGPGRAAVYSNTMVWFL